MENNSLDKSATPNGQISYSIVDRGSKRYSFKLIFLVFLLIVVLAISVFFFFYIYSGSFLNKDSNIDLAKNTKDNYENPAGDSENTLSSQTTTSSGSEVTDPNDLINNDNSPSFNTPEEANPAGDSEEIQYVSPSPDDSFDQQDVPTEDENPAGESD